MQSMRIAPLDGSYVKLHRNDGTSLIAHWTQVPDTIFRDPKEYYWVTKSGRFAEVTFAVAIGWDKLGDS